MWLIKGTLLGAAIFVIFLFVVVYQRLRAGLSTPLFGLLNDWFFGLVLLGCVVAGCLIFLIFTRRRVPKA